MLTPGTPGHEAFVDAVSRGGRGGLQDFNRDGVIDWRDLEVESERIRLVWSASGEPQADSARTFVSSFSSTVSGVAAGVLAQGDHVWFTCIPDLWRFPAATLGDNPVVPEKPTQQHHLLTGFGVHVAFGGHDLHGLIFGPDGRLYFSIADRGTHVTNRENAVIAVPDTGAIFRCEPDGTQFELVATGMRNPQDLAFDDFGNLWTGENNGDGGDKARWTLVLEGADYGWTLGWQWLPGMGAWNAERLWHTQERNSSAFILPPVAYVGHGPAGIAWYPGTGLGPEYQGHFFYSDFPGGIRTFRVEPDGAFFRIPDAGVWLEDNSAQQFRGKLLWDLYPVDVTFPPGGGVMVGDWIRGWEKTGQGRIWHVTDPQLEGDVAIRETARLLAEQATSPGWSGKTLDELTMWLNHDDQRVRAAAQTELKTRPAEWIWSIVQSEEPVRVRWHALYALEQRRREQGLPEESLEWIRHSLTDPEMEIRALAAKLFGEWYPERSVSELLDLAATDPHPRVVAHALLSARMDKVPPGSLPALCQKLIAAGSLALDEDRPKDPVLFHSMVMALHRAGRSSGLIWVLGLQHLNPRIRLATVAAARRSATPFIVQALNDSDPHIVLEAVRAIHDQPILVAQPALLDMLDPDGGLGSRWLGFTLDQSWDGAYPFEPDEWLSWVFRRLLNIQYRRGTAAGAQIVGAFAARPGNPEPLRIQACNALATWHRPPVRDQVTGLYQPIVRRAPHEALQDAMEAVDTWLTRLPSLEEPKVGDQIQSDMPPGVRRAFVSLLGTLEHPQSTLWAQHLVSDPDESVRKEAEKWLPIEVLTANTLRDIVKSDLEPVAKRQAALRDLSTRMDSEIDGWWQSWLEALERGTWPSELKLELIEGLTARNDPEFAKRMAALEAATDASPDTNAPIPFKYQAALHGGDPQRGRQLFVEQADWGCARCHVFRGQGGDVGPDLSGIGSKHNREYLLRSILDPNADMAPGYETTWLNLKNDEFIVGVVESESDTELTVLTAEGARVAVDPRTIESREVGLSMMPEGLIDLMSLSDLRDLLAALAEDTVEE
jgi:quinoprotein glucose dehydrogenase